MSKPRLILVGGFLGAGKTTLLASVARLLQDRGKTVGLITNDQAVDLVDTGMLRHEELNVQEIAGGCFCCRSADRDGGEAERRSIARLHHR
jgi:G3E family GTPase